MAIGAGVDAGAETTKVVILSQGRILSHAVVDGGRESTASVADKALSEAAEKAGISVEDLEFVAGTGMASTYIPNMGEPISDSLCLAKGASWFFPSTKTVLDVGAQKAMAVKCEGGKPVRVATSSKCASGSGRYLESVAKILRIRIEDMAEISLRSTEQVEVSSTCAVFAESELISLVHAKKKTEDILRGVLSSLCRRIYSLLVEVGFERDITMVGGVAKNRGVIRVIESLAGSEVKVPDTPDIVGALGAALIAEGRIVVR